MKVNYDKRKFTMDGYGNLYPKSKSEIAAYDKWLKESRKKLGNTTNVKMPKR